MTTEHTEKLDRIREVAMTAGEAKNAGEIAAAVGVSRNTASKYLSQLVEDDILITEKRGRETTYRPDPVTQYFRQLRELTADYSKEMLTDELVAIREDIERFESEYEVERADELRASVGDVTSADERAKRCRDADDWEYFEHQRKLIQQALRLYDGVEQSRRGLHA